MDLRRGRIFVLGAGFSAGAGLPLTASLLPLAARLFKAEASGLFDRVRNYADQVDVNLGGSPDADDFARLCTHIEFIELREYGGGERWSSHGSREKLALRFFLAKAIAQSTPPADAIPDHYLAFARSLTHDDLVVSFNWDTLLEASLQAVGKQFGYNFEFDRIKIAKLHGSINWIAGQPETLSGEPPKRSDFQPLGVVGGMIETEIFAAPSLQDPTSWRGLRCLVDEVRPLIVLPGYGKAFDVRLLSAFWYRIEALNLWDGGVSIIGLNVSPDDFIVESLFRYLLRGVFASDKPVTVLNPSLEAIARFKKFAGNRDIDGIAEKFDSTTLERALLLDFLRQ